MESVNKVKLIWKESASICNLLQVFQTSSLLMVALSSQGCIRLHVWQYSRDVSFTNALLSDQ
jgi:hypothetical protein